jgi:hypothetical protein
MSPNQSKTFAQGQIIHCFQTHHLIQTNAHTPSERRFQHIFSASVYLHQKNTFTHISLQKRRKRKLILSQGLSNMYKFMDIKKNIYIYIYIHIHHCFLLWYVAASSCQRHNHLTQASRPAHVGVTTYFHTGRDDQLMSASRPSHVGVTTSLRSSSPSSSSSACIRLDRDELLDSEPCGEREREWENIEGNNYGNRNESLPGKTWNLS